MTMPDHAALFRARAALIQLALEEDVGEGDWTTDWTIPASRRCEAEIVAKAPLVVAGVDCVRDVFRAVDQDLDVALVVGDGVSVDAGTVLARLRGRTRSVLVGERTALNFLGRLSGVATLTRRFVDAVSGTGARIIDTRKTTPGWRLLEKAAVRSGGGTNHRLGLHDMILVKDNHADACGGVAEAVRAAVAHNDRGLAVEVEVRTLAELEEVLALAPDRLLLDNMTLDTLRRAVARVRALGDARPETEASGNVTLANVRAVADTGVDLISVGALTHSAPCADVSLRIVS
ncbi:MAG TPA: carboxylating nicotinate-nucleotide diphosphorylase [Longimicrobiales bacterium]|nr:carboxylating nicotinate-nucleotide diphosphorylase [Longimicrobiales bacterium]